MIRLIRADGLEILLNIRIIQTVEGETNPTVVLEDGQRIQVKNSARDIFAKIQACELGSASSDKREKPRG